MNELHYFFDWYKGQVWPNLIASVICTVVVWMIGFRKLVKMHKEHQKQLHNHITQEFANLNKDN